MTRIYIKGFGCSSNMADTEVLEGCLSRAGHRIVTSPQTAELLIFNTCAVKTPTENRIISILKKIPQEKKLVIVGCLPSINLERLNNEVDFDVVAGPAIGEKIVEIVEKTSSRKRFVMLDNSTVNMPSLLLPRVRANPRVSIVPINYGCLGSCTYCCVRFARGKLRSYRIKEILKRIEIDLSEGVREFWLTSQDTACYGKDIGTDLSELLRHICTLKGDFLVRVGMMTPNNLAPILDQLIEIFQSKKVFKFLHLPVQSGDNATLVRMNRLYSTEDFLTAVNRFRKVFEKLTVATDLIVGFPGETEHAFQRTLELVKDVEPDIVNVSKFFGRPHTQAKHYLEKIPALEVKRRSAILSNLARCISFKRNLHWKGWRGNVLVDEPGKEESVVGRNFAYKPVVIQVGRKSDLLGQSVSVEITKTLRSYLLGELVN